MNNYEALIDNLPVGIITIDSDGKLKYMSKTARNLLAFDESYYKNYHISRLLPEELGEIYLKRLEKIVEGEKPEVREYYIKKYDGNYIWLNIEGKPVYSETGQVAKLNIVLQDISEKKRLEEEQKQKNVQYTSLLNNLDDGIIIRNLDDKIIFANKRIYNIFGLEQDESPDKITKELFTSEEKKLLDDEIQKILTNEKQISRVEYRALKKNGKLLWLETTIFPILNNNNTIIAIHTITRDITEKKKYEIALVQSEIKFKSLFNFAKDAIYLIKNNKIIDANPAAADILGYKTEEIIGKTLVDISPEKQSDSIYSSEILKEKIITVLENESARFDWIHQKKDGSQFSGDVMLNKIVIDDENYILAIVRDITEKKLAEEELKKSEERYKSIIHLSKTGAWEYHIKENYVWCSNTYFEILGLNPDNFVLDQENNLDEVWTNYLHPGDRKIALRSFKEYLAKGCKGMYETLFRMKHNNGDWVWILSRGQALKNIDGTSTNIIVGTHIDISERKKYEESIRQSEEMYQKLVTAVPDLIVRTDLKGNIIFINENNIPFLNYYPSKNLLGKNYHTFIVKEDVKKAKDNLKKMMNSSLGVQEYRFKFNNEATIRCEVKGDIIRDKAGKPVELVFIVRDVTDKKNIEEKIRKSSENFGRIFENSPFAMVITRVGKGSVILEVNKAYEILTEKKRENVIGEKINDILLRDLDKKIKNDFLKNNKIENYEFELNIANGNTKVVLLNCQSIDYDNQACILTVMQDITEKKRAEDSINISNANFRRIFSESPFAMSISLIKNELPSILLVNQAYENIYKVKESELKGKFPVSFMENATAVEMRKQLLLNGKLENFEVKKENPDGTITYLQYNSKKIIYDNKLCFLNVIKDITKQKIAELQLLETLGRLNFIIELIPDALFILDKDNKVVAWNKSMEELTGVKKSKVMGKGNFEHSYALYKKRKPILIDLLNDDYVDFEKQYEYITRDGDKIYAEGYDKIVGKGKGRYLWGVATSLYDNNGIRFGAIELIRDITALKNREKELTKYRDHLEELIKERTAELEKVNKLLEKEIFKQKKAEEKVMVALAKEKELNELKTRFISIASHEFRTPLTTIYSSVQLLEKYGHKWTAEMYKSQFDRIKEYVHHMTKIMDDVLTISRTDSGKMQYSPKLQDIYEFFERIVGDVKSVLSTRHIFFPQYKLSDKMFYFDEKLLKQILLNLLTNAVKYSPMGGKIGFVISRQKEYLIFLITDEGIGIPDNEQQDLFEPFHRAANVGEIQGTGLGMSIIKKSVDLHNGKIEFVSKINCGTKFTVKIPVRLK